MTLNELNNRLLAIFNSIEDVERGCMSFFSELGGAAGCELQQINTDTFNKPRITKATLSVYVKKLNNIRLTKTNLLNDLRVVAENLSQDSVRYRQEADRLKQENS